MNSTKVITASSSGSPLSVNYGASDIVQDDIVLHSIVENNGDTIAQLSNTILKNNITIVASNITSFGTNMGEQAVLQDGFGNQHELLMNNSGIVNAGSIYEIPVVKTHPLLGFTFCLVSAIFIGFSFIFQRKANLINNDDEQRKTKHQTSPDQSHAENINDAYTV